MSVNRIVAVKFAEKSGLRRSSFFFGRSGDHLPETVSIDYLVWIIHTERGVVLVDTGFTESVARRRNQHGGYLRSPREAVVAAGVRPDALAAVVLSHLHYDHAGGLADFPAPDVYVQRAEVDFWSEVRPRYPEIDRHAEPDDLAALQSVESDHRLRVLDGDADIGNGVTVHLIGGHTPGTQAVRVDTAAGPLVLACDASHMQANIDERLPIGVFTDLRAVYAGYERLVELADGDPGRVVAGHDPAVMQRATPLDGLDGIAGRVG